MQDDFSKSGRLMVRSFGEEDRTLLYGMLREPGFPEWVWDGQAESDGKDRGGLCPSGSVKGRNQARIFKRRY